MAFPPGAFKVDGMFVVELGVVAVVRRRVVVDVVVGRVVLMMDVAGLTVAFGVVGTVVVVAREVGGLMEEGLVIIVVETTVVVGEVNVLGRAVCVVLVMDGVVDSVLVVVEAVEVLDRVVGDDVRAAAVKNIVVLVVT